MRSAVYAALVHYLSEKEYLRILPFDAAYNTTATIEDIDNEKVAISVGVAKENRGFPLPIGSSIETVLTHLDLITSEGRISNAALLLFGKQPQKFFISSEVKCAQFYGNEITKPIPSYASGYIVASHPDNPTHPDQVYSLTEKGRNLRRKIIKE